jgi:membrane associated rhomboid family serine protease
MMGIAWLLLLLTASTLTPFNVVRPTRGIAYVTYSLIGVNIFIFLMTVFVANVDLPADQVRGREAVMTLLSQDRGQARAKLRSELGKMRDIVGVSPNVDDHQLDAILDRLSDNDRRHLAAAIAFERADDAQGYQQYWQIIHLNSSYVLEPHYSILNLFAYRPAEKSIGSKLLGLLGSMFIHGGLWHLAGNMLFLWVFGRALEEYLGPRLYLLAYLLAGVAATLAYHIVTLTCTPSAAAIPSMGASGAIAGVLGLFVMRFYRTPVRIFYVLPTTWVVIFVGGSIGTFVLLAITHSLTTSLTGGFGAVIALLAIFGRQWAWSSFTWASAFSIGTWAVLFNLMPALIELTGPEQHGSGIAYWAHIGGFLFGMLYAALIGSGEEGAIEYALEDARKELAFGDAERAIYFGEKLLRRSANFAEAHDILARAHDDLKHEHESVYHYDLAIANYLRTSQRSKAAQLYLHALKRHPRFMLPPTTQLVVGNQMARNHNYENAAHTLLKIIYSYPKAPEAEISLLRSAQIYLRELDHPQTALQLLHEFRQRYPESHWKPQWEQAWKVARHQVRSLSAAAPAAISTTYADEAANTVMNGQALDQAMTVPTPTAAQRVADTPHRGNSDIVLGYPTTAPSYSS